MSATNIVRKALKIAKTEGLGELAKKAVQRLREDKFAVPAKLDMVVVEVTTYCNLKCSGCVRTVMSKEEGQWEDRHVDVDDFRRMINDLPPAKSLIPQGIGEPTMHPRILELLGIARSANKFDRIEINTNGLVRSTDFYGQLFEAGLTNLTVSVDSLDDDVIEIVRSGTEIPKLEKRLKEFSARFPGKIGIRVTVSKWNKDRLSALLAKLNRIGSFDVWLQPFFDMGNGGGVLDKEEADALVKGLDALTAPFGNLKVLAEPFERSEEVCTSPWRSPAIRVDGQVKPCCMIFYQEKIEFGNAFTTPFHDLWNSERVAEFREDFVKKSPDCCSRCPYFKQRH